MAGILEERLDVWKGLCTVEDYGFYAKKFFSQHKILFLETLKAALSGIPPAQYAKWDKVYKTLVCEGYLSPEFLEGAKHLRLKRHIPAKRTSVDEIELDELLKACKTPMDNLIITLLAHTGIRASEACQLKIADIELEKGILAIRCGKGGKARRVGLSQDVVAALKSYLNSQRKLPSNYLFLNRDGNPMDRHGLHRRIKRIARDAGISAYPHALRRAFVTQNANKGRPLPIHPL